MSAQLMRMLGQIVLDRKEELLRLGLSVDELPSMCLFQNQVGQPKDESKVRKVFARLLTKAGLAKGNLNFLRHTFATLLIQQGEGLAYVKEQMGTPRSISPLMSTAIWFPVVTAKRSTSSMTARKFLTNLLWKQNGNILSQKRLLRRRRRYKFLKAGATRRSRTGDLLITNQLLCRLS